MDRLLWPHNTILYINKTCDINMETKKFQNSRHKFKKLFLFFLGLGFLFKFAHKFTSLNCPNITIKLWKQKR